jgi:predicted nuclease of predicted toxin-antitoxin system
MKLLLDENIPVKLKFRLIDAGFTVSTVRDMKWLGKENGELLKLMLSNNFTTLITIDNNLSFQNNFHDYPIQVVVMVAPDNTYDTIMQFFPALVEKLKENFIGVKVIVHPNYKNRD